MRKEPSPCSDIFSLHPTFRNKLEAVLLDLQRQGICVLLTETWRSHSRQQYLYSLGRTQAGDLVTHDLHSLHEKGRAADLCFIKHTRATYHGPWKLVQQTAQKYGLTWGGTWPAPYTEKAHLQWEEEG